MSCRHHRCHTTIATVTMKLSNLIISSLLAALSVIAAQKEPYVYIIYYEGEDCQKTTGTATGVIPIVGDEGAQNSLFVSRRQSHNDSLQFDFDFSADKPSSVLACLIVYTQTCIGLVRATTKVFARKKCCASSIVFRNSVPA